MPHLRAHASARLSLGLVAILLLYVLSTASARGQAPTPSDPPQSAAPDLLVMVGQLRLEALPRLGPGIRRRALARPRTAVLGDARTAPPERLTLNLFADLHVVATRVRTAAIDADATYWVGRIDGPVEGQASFVMRGRWLAGHVHVDGRTIVIQSQADGLHTVDEVDEATQPRCGGARPPVASVLGAANVLGDVPSSAAQPVAAMPAAAASVPTIDLLVVYTPAARAGAGGSEPLRAGIDLAVAQMNEALVNSDVPGVARLVDSREVAYTESGSMSTDLDRLTTPFDAFLDEVHTLRNQSGADLVVLITEHSVEGWSGLAWIMTNIQSPFASYGFSVVRRQGLPSYTLAHEVGHNLGLAHNPEDAAFPGVFPDAYGYRDPPYFRDVMSYNCPLAWCLQIAHFSNPQVFYQGRPTGRVNLENGARALRQTLPIAAQFRTAPAATLTSVSPMQGPTLGGIRVTLSGTGLASVTRVTFGPYEATDPMLVTSELLSVMLPSHPQGPVTVRVEDAAGDGVTLGSAFVYEPSGNDADGDALPDDWETAMGLLATDGTGANGPFGDPDLDGVTNLEEWRGHGHPRGFHRLYFAEGSASSFFQTRVARLNYQDTEARTLVRREYPDGSRNSSWDVMPARTMRTTYLADQSTGGASFATVVESDVPIVVDRTMTWDTATGYGAHTERGITAPALTWYLAEGATHSGFDLFYLLQNPATTATTVRVRYLRPSGSPLVKEYLLPPTSRTDIWVNVESFTGLGRALASTDVSAVIESLDNTPVIVERAMYLSNQGRDFNAGHASAGVTAPATEWFLAEGATGPYFDLFVLVANPNAQDAQVTVTYLLIDGTTYARTLVAPANSRVNIWVDVEQIPGVAGFPLEDVAVSTTVTSTNGVPIVVERAMWWPGSFATWHEAHNSPGSTVTGTRWALAEGAVGGARGEETYILIANTSAFDGKADVTLYFEDGGPPVVHVVDLPARARTNVPVADLIGMPAQVRRFGVVVESVGGTPAQIVVERAQYSNASGVPWAAGSNALATRLP